MGRFVRSYGLGIQGQVVKSQGHTRLFIEKTIQRAGWGIRATLASQSLGPISLCFYCFFS